ncbi:aspartate/glutamate racemase family protein [Frankia sp. Cas3]|uniref:aspartate/glutamate racemase family protein n=1 Tax=Frankia sp. Cas3 TaxID=3073926 RepID=UPI002AD20B36|nr:aspartate/glutamate racemase family protein [Frankia sp. Cas3]
MSRGDAGTVRIWHQSMATLSEFGQYQDLLRAHIAKVMPQDVTVDIHGAQAKSYGGRPPAHVLRYPYLKYRIQTQAIEACRQAEAAGYDAVAMATFGDPYLRECRSMVGIPVASMPESCLFVASSLAARSALICLTPTSIPRVRELVDGHGMTSRVSGIYSLDPPASEHVLVQLMAGQELGNFTDSLQRAAELAATAGAEMLIPAEGALNELLWSRGITSIAGLPVLDALGVTLSYTRLLVHLQRYDGMETSRVSTFARPPADWVADIEAALQPERR